MVLLQQPKTTNRISLLGSTLILSVDVPLTSFSLVILDSFTLRVKDILRVWIGSFRVPACLISHIGKHNFSISQLLVQLIHKHIFFIFEKTLGQQFTAHCLFCSICVSDWLQQISQDPEHRHREISFHKYL